MQLLTSKSSMEAKSTDGEREVANIGTQLEPHNDENSDGEEDEAGEHCGHDCRGTLLRLTEHVLQQVHVY